MTLTPETFRKTCAAVLKAWALLAVVVCLAVWNEVRAAVSIAVGGEVTEKSRYLEVRHDSEWWGAWAATIGGAPRLGVETHIVISKFLFGVGAVVAQPDERVSTAMRYELRAEWNINNQFSLGLVHESNCRNICDSGVLTYLPHGSKNTRNEGFNFLVLRARW